MKTILAPTDFSTTSRNAIDYAMEIARLSGARLILFHAYHIPPIATEAPVAIPALDEIEKRCIKDLEKIEKDLRMKHGTATEIEHICKCGFAVEEINQYAKEENISLVVMGMHGSGYLSEKFIGSITTSLMRKAACPVLAIDRHVRFKNIKKIVLACDYNEIGDRSILNPLKTFSLLFNSHIYVLNVVRDPAMTVTVNRAATELRLEHLLEDINHSFHYTKNEDIVKGIHDFVEEHKTDMVVMIPREHSFLRNIFHEPETTRMAFHTRVPLLSLHE